MAKKHCPPAAKLHAPTVNELIHARAWARTFTEQLHELAQILETTLAELAEFEADPKA